MKYKNSLPQGFFQTLEDRILFDAAIDPALVVQPDDQPVLDPAVQTQERNEPIAATEQDAERARLELVIVDRSVQDYQSLVDDLSGQEDSARRLDVVLLDVDSDGIEQLSRILKQYQNLDALHIVSHGEDGEFRMGNLWVNQLAVQAHAGEISGWGDAFTSASDILLYGCDVATSAEGRDLVSSLAALTGADVAASSDTTGAAHRGGDWQLEVSVGEIETTVAFSTELQHSFQHLLAVGPTVQLPSTGIEAQIGENIEFEVIFDNTGTEVGYGPFIDLLLPTAGIDGDDGIAFNGATYLGAEVNATLLTFNDQGGGFGTVEHPYLASPINETQAITISPSVTGGSFRLSFGGQTTNDIAFDANNSAIQLALESLSTVAVGDISLSGALVDGYVLIEFVGPQSQTDLAAIVIDDTNLIGGSAHHITVNDGSANPTRHKLLGRAGDQLVVLELPFGSYAPGQPEARVLVSATVSDLADVSQPLNIQARSGFRFGADPLDNADADPMHVSDLSFDVTGRSGASSMWSENVTVTPAVMTMRNHYVGPESETVTGPSFERTYQIHVDIADGQTISDLAIIDALPSNIVVTGIASVTAGGIAVGYTDNLAALTVPGNNQELIVTLQNGVTGTASDSDVLVSFTFYVAEFDGDGNRVIPLNGEDDSTFVPDSRSINNVRAQGQWQPIDVRDSSVVAIADPAGPEHVLDNKAISIQKSVAIVGNVGGVGATPGDTLEYTLDFQISDFYTFGDLQITDIFQDGQRFDFSYGATFSITDLSGNVSGSFTVRQVTDSDGGQTLVVDQTQIDHSDDIGEDGLTPDGSDGSTTLVFDISRALVDQGATDGILQGGLSTGPMNLGGAFGQVKFRTIIQEEYSDTFVSEDRSVDQGDTITNNSLTITGTVRENAEDDELADGFAVLERVLHTESDHSATSITIQGGVLEKTVYAINGSTSLPINAATGKVTLVAGDVVTYRISYELPSTDIEDLVITDYLPLPIFHALDHDADGTDNSGSTFGWTFDLAGSFDATTPGTGTIQFGNNDTFYAIAGVTPTISVDPGSNSISLNFGDFDDSLSRASTIELLVSVTASDAPTADGLFLTNMVRATEGTTQNDVSLLDRIVQVEMTQPKLSISKGIVATDQADSVFDGGTGPVVFAGVGEVGTFTGTLTSSNLAGSAVDANVSNLEAGDRVRYAIVIENYGSSSHGAHDVQIRDLLPPGMTLIAGSLQVVDGTGAAHTFVDADVSNPGLFGAGIVLNDPGPTPNTSGANSGSVDGMNATSGRNIVVIVYDVQITDAAQVSSTLVNQAEIVHYASLEGGQNHAAELSDGADASLRSFAGAKSIVSTSESHTNLEAGVERVAIGEIVRYRLAVEIPQGSVNNLQVRDLLPSGLTFLDDGTVMVALVSDGGLTSSTLSGAGLHSSNLTVTPSYALADAASSSSTTFHDDNFLTGTDPYFYLGNIVNADNDANAEYVIIEFNALVDNNNGPQRNDSGDLLENRFEVIANGATAFTLPTADSPRVAIVEPLLTQPTITSNVASADAGDSIVYTLAFSVASGVDASHAFNVRLDNTLPSHFTFDSLTAIRVDGVIVTAGDAAYPTSVAQSGNMLSVTFEQLNEGQTVEIVYSGTLDATVTPSAALTNTANLTWTSLPGAYGTNAGVGNSTGNDLASLDGVSTGGNGELASKQYSTSSGGIEGMRDGSNVGFNPNNYYRTSSQTLTAEPTSISKTLIGTEIVSGNNGFAQVVIGELVTYEIQVSFPEGTLPDAIIVDTLDPGLAFVEMVSTTSNGFNYTGSLTPTIVNSGRVLTWNLGNVSDSNLADDSGGTITLRYRAVATNSSGNQSGATLDNTVRLGWGNNPANDRIADAEDVTVVEPTLTKGTATKINGTANQSLGDAGDPITYTIEITNNSGVDAFDISFRDTFPIAGAFTAVVSATYAIHDTAGIITAADFTMTGSNASAYVLTYTGAAGKWDMLASEVGRTITIYVSGTLSSEVVTNQSYFDNPFLSWSSLDGNVQNRSTHDPASDERVGTNTADNTADYLLRDPIAFTVDSPTISKSFVSTDRSETSGTNVTIGEKVTYSILVTLPEGVTNGFTIVDHLPPGLKYDSFVFDTVGYNGTFAPPTVSGGSVDGQDVTFSFGTLRTLPDNNPANDSFRLLVTALVSDVASNTGYTGNQSVLTNTASLDIQTDSFGPITTNGVDVTVVESDLTITKSIDLSEVNAGDEVTVTLTVANNGPHTAYEVRISDLLDDAVYNWSSLLLGSAGVEYPADFVAAFNSATGLLTYSGGDIASGATATFQFRIRIDDDVVLGQNHVNTARITDATTLDGSNSVERNMTDSDGDGDDVSSDSVYARANSIAGSVYFDVDNDGIREGGETGIENVVVRLEGTDHLGRAVDRILQTNASGDYLFANLHPGIYRVTETQPATAPNGKDYLDGIDTVGSAGGSNATNDRISDIILATTVETASTGNNFGELEEITLSGVVYHDANNNGLMDGAEVGIGGVRITLSGTNDQGAIAPVVFVTNSDGSFHFNSLRPGVYTLTQTQPTFNAPSGRAYADGRDGDGSLANGDATSVNDSISSIELSAGDAGSNYRFGEIVESVLSGYVFNDLNNDGDRTDGVGLSGIAITLTGTDDLGNLINRTATTSGTGYYEFANLRPSSAAGYTLSQAAQPGGYLDGIESIGSLGGVVGIDLFSQIQVTSDTVGMEYNFAELRPNSLGGVVFHDRNNNGLIDSGEEGISGVTLTLTGTDDLGTTVNLTATTDASGSYAFLNLRPTDLIGYAITQSQPGNWNDGLHVDGSLGNGNTAVVNVISGIELIENAAGTGYNFGERGATLSGTTFVDDNRDGILDAGENRRISGVRVELYDSTNTVLLDFTDTLADGSYSFANLAADDYVIRQIQPLHYSSTSSNTLATTLSLTGTSNQNFGEALFDIGDVVYYDANRNGLQDSGEQGLVGVDVQLVYDGGDGIFGNGNDTVLNTTTVADGLYSFSELVNGNYRVAVVGGTPVGATPTAETDDGPAIIDGTSNIVINGADRFDVDFGFGGSVALGDFVFFDRNGNGIQDADDLGLANISVQLQFAGDDGIFGNADDRLFNTVTSGTGSYAFENLIAGQYRINVDTSDSDLPTGLVGVTGPESVAGVVDVTLVAGAGNNALDFGFTGTHSVGDTVFYDLDGNGTQDGSEPGIVGVTVQIGIDLDGDTVADYFASTVTDQNGWYAFDRVPNGTHTVTLVSPAGTSPTTNHDGAAGGDNSSVVTISGASDLTQDFGFLGTGSIGETVYWDANNSGSQDTGEIGLFNVPVQLEIDFNGDGTVDYTLATSTDIDGKYLFANLPAGTYTVIVTPLAGTVQTEDPDATLDNRSTVVLASGESRLDQTFGYRGQAAIGDRVYFDYLGDSGVFLAADNDRGMGGVDVTLSFDVDGDSVADYSATTVTAADGTYLFSNLIAGDYTITIDASDLPDQMGLNPTFNIDSTLDNTTRLTLFDSTTRLDVDFGYHAHPDYQITVTDHNTHVVAGQLLTYDIDLVNNGTYRGQNVRVTAQFQTNELENVTATAGGVVDAILGTVTWNIPILDDGEFRQLQISGNVASSLGNSPAPLTVAVTVSDDLVNGIDPSLANNADTDTDQIAEIGALKNVTSVVANGNNWDVTFAITVVNTGSVRLDDLTLFDNLVAQFGSQLVGVGMPTIDVGGMVGGVAPTINTAWMSNTALDLLDPSVLGEFLNPGDSFVVSFTATVDPDQSGTAAALYNQAIASGRDITTIPGSPVSVSDWSDSGTMVGSTNQGDPGDQGTADDPTPVYVPDIAVAKQQTAATQDPVSRNYTVTYTLFVENIGTVTLDGISLNDDVASRFGNAFVGIEAGSLAINNPQGQGVFPTVNRNWESDTSQSLINGGSSIASGSSFEITFRVVVDPDGIDGQSNYVYNQAVATGRALDERGMPILDSSGRPTIVSDDSDSGFDTHTTNPGEPGDAGSSDDPTPLILPEIGAAKRLVASAGETSNRELTYEIVIRNLGTVDLDNLTLTEDLRSQFGVGFLSVVAGPAIVSSTATADPTLSSWNGSSDIEMFDGVSGRLRPGEEITLRFAVLVDLGQLDPTSTNQVIVSGDYDAHPGVPGYDGTVADWSDSGFDPAGNNPGGAGDTGGFDDPTPTPIPTPIPTQNPAQNPTPVPPTSSALLQIADVGVAKSIVQAKQHGLAYALTIDFVIANTGNVDLVDLELFDDLRTQYGDNFSRVLAAPRIISSNAAVDPVVSNSYATDTSQSMFDGVTGVLRPGESLTVRMVVEVVQSPDAPILTLINQAIGTAMPLDENGDPLRDPFGELVGRISDLSDSGLDPTASNPGAPGDMGTWDDATPINLRFYTFDAFNDFSRGEKGLLQGDKRDPSRMFDAGTEFPIDRHHLGHGRELSQSIQRLAPDPIFSGSARPGTQIVGRIFDSAGRLIGEELSLADVGGNWMMQFHQVGSTDHARIEFVEVPGTENRFDYRGDAHGYLGREDGGNHYGSLQPWTNYKHSHDFSANLRPSVHQSLLHEHRVLTRPLSLGR
ncbi:MAG: SdrD B-like domain-containing protein [Pirellulaceae bacterium]